MGQEKETESHSHIGHEHVLPLAAHLLIIATLPVL